MYWKRRYISYKIQPMPLSKPFELLTEEEAKKFFIWYINNINERIEYLQEASELNLNYNEASLIGLWKWFIEIAKIEKRPKEKLNDMKKELANSGQSMEFINEVLKDNKKQFSLETEYILLDIAMYFGEVYVRNYKCLRWGYHTNTKLDSFANMPLIMGFEDRDYNPPFLATVSPMDCVRATASSILIHEEYEKELYDDYCKPLRMVHEN